MLPKQTQKRAAHSGPAQKRAAHSGPARCAYGGQRRSRTWQSPRAAPQASTPTLCVPGAREGPAPRARVSSLWALPCPLPGVSNPLGGADALPCPSSLGAVTVAAPVKPSSKTGPKEGSPFRSRTLCARGSAQTQAAARPHAGPLSLPLW